MPLLTTTIGAYPKPEYVRLPDWFTHPEGPDAADPTRGWSTAMKALGDDAEAIITRGVGEAIDDQVAAGIDVPTDGEIARENYIHYHCRHLDGVSFERLEEKALRNDAYRAFLPTIVGPVRAGAPFLPIDYRRAQSFTDKAVKITMPGPMTIADTTVDVHYDDPRALGRDLAAALNREVLALADAGCRHIQIDEPLFARRPDAALEFGFENLERAFHGCPEHVTRPPCTCAAAIPTGSIGATIPRPIRTATSGWPTRWRKRQLTRSASRTPIGRTTCRFSNDFVARRSSSEW